MMYGHSRGTLLAVASDCSEVMSSVIHYSSLCSYLQSFTPL